MFLDKKIEHKPYAIIVLHDKHLCLSLKLLYYYRQLLGFCQVVMISSRVSNGMDGCHQADCLYLVNFMKGNPLISIFDVYNPTSHIAILLQETDHRIIVSMGINAYVRVLIKAPVNTKRSHPLTAFG